MTESLRDIRLFVAAYEERSFTLAAIREHATQSGVSQHIRTLELRYAVKLFERDKAGVTPTPAAQAYYSKCVDILRMNDDANVTIRRFSSSESGTIFVGLMPTMTRSCLAPTVRRFVEDFPNVTLRLVEAYSGTLTRQVVDGELDFAIVPAFVGIAGLKARSFLRTIETLVSSPGCGLPHLSAIRLNEIPSLKLVVPGIANTRRLTLDTYLTSNSIPVERFIEIDAMMGALDFVANSDWRAVLPGIMMASDIGLQRFTVNPIANPDLSLDLVLIEPSRRTMSHAASSFLKILEEEAIRLNNLWDGHRA